MNTAATQIFALVQSEQEWTWNNPNVTEWKSPSSCCRCFSSNISMTQNKKLCWLYCGFRFFFLSFFYFYFCSQSKLPVTSLCKLCSCCLLCHTALLLRHAFFRYDLVLGLRVNCGTKLAQAKYYASECFSNICWNVLFSSGIFTILKCRTIS